MKFFSHFALTALLLLPASAAMAAVTITRAEISGGKLTVEGTSTIGNKVKLDGQFTANVNAGTHKFAFSLTYLP